MGVLLLFQCITYDILRRRFANIETSVFNNKTGYLFICVSMIVLWGSER